MFAKQWKESVCNEEAAACGVEYVVVDRYVGV